MLMAVRPAQLPGHHSNAATNPSCFMPAVLLHICKRHMVLGLLNLSCLFESWRCSAQRT